MNKLIDFFYVCILTIMTTNIIHAQTPFKMDDIPAPLFRCPIFDGAADPAIQWCSETNEWWLFYTQRRANVPNIPGVSYCYGTNIGIATSADNGKTWVYKDVANLPNISDGVNTFWAPDIYKIGDTYYMLVTYIKGVRSNWGGGQQILLYSSKNLLDWKFIHKIEGLNGIDAQAYQMDDGSWKLWYKSSNAKTYSAVSKDGINWIMTNQCEIDAPPHEGPIVFKWKNKYWNIIDPCTLSYSGLHCYESNDGTHWKFNSCLLDEPGIRPDDFDQGRHADVVVIDDRAFMFYFTHPGRKYNLKRVDTMDKNGDFKRSSIQMVELNIENGKIVCDRNFNR